MQPKTALWAIVPVSATVLIGRWYDPYHLIVALAAFLVAAVVAVWWRKSHGRLRGVGRPRRTDVTGRSLRGLVSGTVVILYLHVAFWLVSMTPAFQLFYPCERSEQQVTQAMESKTPAEAMKEIDAVLSARLSADCKQTIAREKASLLIRWADALPARRGLDILDVAVKTAQEYDLQNQLELALAKRQLLEFRTAPTDLAPGCVGGIHAVETSLFPTIIVYFWLEDTQGLQVNYLSAKDIRVVESGQVIEEFELSRFVHNPEPLYVAFCVDQSGSMRHSLNDVRSGVTRFVDLLSTKDVTELITFGDTVKRVVGWTENEAILVPRLAELEASGGTAMVDAVWLALEDLSNEVGSRVVVLVTDGADTRSVRHLDDVVDLAVMLGIPVYVIAIVSPELDRATLNQIASGSGGAYLEVATTAELEKAYEAVAGRLQNAYRLVFQSKSQSDSVNTLSITAGGSNAVHIETSYDVKRVRRLSSAAYSDEPVDKRVQYRRLDDSD